MNAGSPQRRLGEKDRATEEALLAGRKPECKAEETDRYTTLDGATACLLEDYHVAGLSAQHDHPRLIP